VVSGAEKPWDSTPPQFLTLELKHPLVVEAVITLYRCYTPFHPDGLALSLSISFTKLHISD